MCSITVTAPPPCLLSWEEPWAADDDMCYRASIVDMSSCRSESSCFFFWFCVVSKYFDSAIKLTRHIHFFIFFFFSKTRHFMAKTHYTVDLSLCRASLTRYDDQFTALKRSCVSQLHWSIKLLRWHIVTHVSHIKCWLMRAGGNHWPHLDLHFMCIFC